MPGSGPGPNYRKIAEKVGVADEPVSSFYLSGDLNVPGNYARFCFCKKQYVLQEASRRLKTHFGRVSEPKHQVATYRLRPLYEDPA